MGVKISSEVTKEIIELLKNGLKSEDPRAYADEDFSWGPALGVAARNAKESNKRAREIIHLLKEQLHESD